MEEKKILESWKEIASYLKRSEKTCQRWEIELGLPIHSELKKGNLTKAINDLEKAQSLELKPLSIPPSFIIALASAYYQAGKLESARKEYEKIPLLTQGRLLRGYPYATSLYMLGRVCEQQGDRAKAIENYGKFLDLWKDADRIHPEVEEARARLARLTSH